MTINWNDIYSKTIKDAFRAALEDHQLTHEEVVEVLRTVLADGELSGVEVNDLQKIAGSAETIPGRSKFLLQNLAFEVADHLSYGRIYFSTDRQKFAANMLCDFLKRTGPQSFPHLDRSLVGIDLLLRVANPNIINQRMAGLCGPVSFLYGLAFDSPGAYAKLGTDLFENGKAKIGKIDVNPGSDCRNYSPPGGMAHGEWVTAGSLRDSENFLLDFDDVGEDFAASTTASEVAKWFSDAGYTDVHEDDNLFSSRSASDIDYINKYFNDGYRIVLRINAKLLDKDHQGEGSSRGNHFVVLRSPIAVAGETVSLTVYTWGGGNHIVPAAGTKMTPGGFREHWYGYIVAKPF